MLPCGMSLNIATLLSESAKARPQHPAIVIGDVSISYATLDGHARRFGSALRGFGLQPGQHIALMLPNVPQFTAAYFGAHYAGQAVVPLNVLLKGDEVAYHLEDSDAQVLVVWEGFLEEAQAGFQRADGCKHLVVVKQDPQDSTAPEGMSNFGALLRSHEPIEQITPTNPDDTAVILYTSGTTGRPKGAELSHVNMFMNADFCRSRLLEVGEDDVGLVVLPLFHSFGQTVLQNTLLFAGGTLVMLPRFDPTAALGLMQKHRVSVFGGVPTMYFALLHHPEADQFDLSGLKTCVCGGSAMPVEVMNAFDAKYGVNILEGYGLSETSPVASFNMKNRPKKVGSIGLPIWGVEVRLRDDAGNIVNDPSVPGEIQIKGYNVMKGYYKRPEVNREAIDPDGWFSTGDIATRDEEGYYFIVDRKKDMIIRGGFNVYPREIEEVLYGHPAVGEAAVIGIPHDSHGEEVKAVVALKPGQSVTAEDLIAFCKAKLAAYKYPRHIDIIDSLPKGPTGKILKRELRG